MLSIEKFHEKLLLRVEVLRGQFEDPDLDIGKVHRIGGEVAGIRWMLREIEMDQRTEEFLKKKELEVARKAKK